MGVVSMARYDKQQQAACLSNLSNLLFKAKRPYAELQQILSTGTKAVLSHNRVHELIGEWNIVWGPVVRSVKYDDKAKVAKHIPDNVCFVAKTTQFGHDTYLIAIAGTNSKSLKEDICNQDLRVRPVNMVEWSSISGARGQAGKIALGTSMGLKCVLENIVDPIHGSLTNWLVCNNFAAGSELITAGDKLWAEHAMKSLNGQFYGRYNTLDAVPRAWDRIDTVKTLYVPYGLKPRIPIKAGIKVIERLVGKNNPYCRCAGWTSFEGTFNPNAPGSPKSPFMNQIMYQHLLAYVEPMGYQEYFKLQEEIFPRPQDGR